MRGTTCVWMFTVLLGCAPASRTRTPPEDQTRRVAPVPACIMRLPARGPQSEGTLRRLRETDIVKLVIPAFDERTRALPPTVVICTGETLDLGGGATLHSGSKEEDGDVLYGSGGDRIKVVWLRVRSFPDGTVAGPIALVRGREDVAEAFSVGTYRGPPDRVVLRAERMANRLAVRVESDGCRDRKPGAPCETVASIFLPRLGRLERVVDTPMLRVGFADKGELGIKGPIEYRLSSTMTYGEDGIHVTEKLETRNATGDTVRSIERDRAFLLRGDGAMSADVPSLWKDTLTR